MDNEETVKIFLENPEWTTFEYKRAATDPSKLLETIVAFANTSGGCLVIGLEDQYQRVKFRSTRKVVEITP